MATGTTTPAPTEFADTDCRFCAHSGDAHDAGECWAEKSDTQCTCWWYTPLSEVTNAGAIVAPYLHAIPTRTETA
jgi:hypothetical protein